MTGLEPRADRAVRDAVDAFLEGRLRPEYAGETVFETKNSRYRLFNGVLYSAPDASLVGAELVGWLMESAKRSTVGSAWQATSRAVLVDRKRGRHIIVTSSTCMLHLEEESPFAGSSAAQDGSSVHPPRSAPPLPTPRHLPTPTPSPLPRVHAPPRPMQPRIPQPTAPTPLARPLPYPAAPPRRVSPAPLPTLASSQMGPLPPPGRLPLPRPLPPPHRHAEVLREAEVLSEEEVESIDFDDEATSSEASPFLLARLAVTSGSIPPPSSHQPFPLARVMERGAPLR